MATALADQRYEADTWQPGLVAPVLSPEWLTTLEIVQESIPVATYIVEEWEPGPKQESSVVWSVHQHAQWLEQIFAFSDSDEIWRFLLTYEWLSRALLEAHGQILRVFAENAENNIVDLSLEYSVDPEEGYEELFVIIRTNLSVAESLARLEKFDEEWWLEVDAEVRSLVGVDVRSIT
jgi:hypothetical protein